MTINLTGDKMGLICRALTEKINATKRTIELTEQGVTDFALPGGTLREASLAGLQVELTNTQELLETLMYAESITVQKLG